MGLLIPPLRPGERVATMSDERLHECFRETGQARTEAEALLSGMLGEIDRRGIARRAGFGSVGHYANVLAGLSADQIELALRIDRKVADLPRLREVFQNARAPLNCLRVILGVATPERDAELAEHVVSRSKAELEELARKYRQTPPANEAPQATLGFGPSDTVETPPAERPATPGAERDMTPESGRPGTPAPAPAVHEPAHPAGTAHVQITIRAVVHERLEHQQARLSAVRGRPVSLDEVLLALLDGDTTRSKYLPVIRTTPAGEPVSLRTGDGDVPITAADLAGMEPACAPLDLEREREELEALEAARPGGTRRRSARLERYLLARSGGRCEMGVCRRPGTGKHHWNPFGNGGKHTPSNLSVGCSPHLGLADQGLVVRTADGRIHVRVRRPDDPATRQDAQARVYQDQFVKHRRWAIERARRRPLKKKS